MPVNKKGSGVSKGAQWLGTTNSAYRHEQEQEDDAKFNRREKVGNRIKRLGIKVGAKFTGHVGRSKKKVIDEYVVASIDTDKNVVILKGKKDAKTRRVSVLNEIFDQ